MRSRQGLAVGPRVGAKRCGRSLFRIGTTTNKARWVQWTLWRPPIPQAVCSRSVKPQRRVIAFVATTEKIDRSSYTVRNLGSV